MLLCFQEHATEWQMKVNKAINWLNKLSKLNQTALDVCLYDGDGTRVSVCSTVFLLLLLLSGSVCSAKV